MREADRSAVRPVALAPVVVWAAGVFTLFAVSYFAVWASRNVALGARFERHEERVEMIGYVLGRSLDRPDLDVMRLVQVMDGVPRHRFVPVTERANAYRGHALPIGWGRTTPDAYIVALMADLAVPVLTHEVEMGIGRDASVFTTFTVPVSGHKVLEVGTGSGYLAAVLSEMVDHVYTIEPVEPLAVRAAATLGDLGYGNVTVRVGDPFQGWPEHAPFDSIVVKAPVAPVPQTLIDQLAVGGRLVVMVDSGSGVQELRLLRKRADGSVGRTQVVQLRSSTLISSGPS